MKKKFIHFLLLFSLFFNIAHAAIIAVEESCQHESVYEYIAEQSHASECDDLCELHHLFHFMAVLSHVDIHLDIQHTKTLLAEKPALYTSALQQTSIKPPIA